jgi:hypothetical protein
LMQPQFKPQLPNRARRVVNTVPATLHPSLPYNKEAEIAILGAILLDSPAAPEAIDNLEPNDFFLPFHKVIFQHMKRLRAEGTPTNDFVLLHDVINRSKALAAAGGTAYIATLADGQPRVSNLARYVQIVKTQAQARSAIYSFQTNIERLLSANGDLDVVLQEIAINSAHPIYVKYGQKQSDPFETAADLCLESNLTEFVVEPYLAAGAVTDLVAKIKAGKTTFILGEFVRKALEKGPVVYLTEQPKASFRVALNRAGLFDSEKLTILYFHKVTALEWPEIARLAVEKCRQVNAVLLVVDTLSHFAGLEGDSENDSGAAIACMKPLQAAAATGISVLTSRHERKSGGEIGDAGRGSSAFGGAADTLLSLRRLAGRTRSTLRKIECISRFDGLPAEAIFEYIDGQYQYMGTENEISDREAEKVVLGKVPDSKEYAKDLAALVEGSEVARTTAQRVIKRLVGEGKLAHLGKGKKGSTFRYFLPEKDSAQTPHIHGQKETNHEWRAASADVSNPQEKKTEWRP